MPYQIIQVGKNKYSVVNVESGKIHSYGTTYEKAKRQYRLLNGVEHGFKPKNRRRK